MVVRKKAKSGPKRGVLRVGECSVRSTSGVRPRTYLISGIHQQLGRLVEKFLETKKKEKLSFNNVC
jgi:hypothetical protein